jgi:hypothetical protein
VQFRKINHGHNFEIFILTSKVWGLNSRDFEDTCKVGTKWQSEMKRGIGLGTILWIFITCFHVSAKFLWYLKVAHIEKNAHVFIFEIHYNKTTMGTILK